VPIEQINNISSPGSYQTPPTTHAERSGSDVKRDMPKTSSKYIVENNKIVFERYDRYGKLVTKVPWSAYTLSEKA
jgi:hypothetical protein